MISSYGAWGEEYDSIVGPEPGHHNPEAGVVSSQMLGTGLLAVRRVKDGWGFVYDQHADGSITVVRALATDFDGSPAMGTEGGPGQGQVLRPPMAMWHKVTRMIGSHPFQAAHAARVRSGQLAGWGGWFSRDDAPTTAEEITFEEQDRTRVKFDSSQEGGAGWNVLTDVLSAFTPEPTMTKTGQVSSAIVDATPGIQSFLYGLIHPGTYTSLSKELGRLQADLARTTDPGQRAMLESRIRDVQWQLSNLQGSMSSSSEGAPVDSFPWLPIALGVGLITIIGGIALYMGKKQ